MKNYITPAYTFTPGASGVGTIATGIVNFDIKLLVAIVNITRETIIYAPSLTGRGYTAINGETITLEFNTTGQSSADVLQFIYESTPNYPAHVNTGEVLDALRQVQGELEILKNSIGQVRVDSAGRLRILLDSITTSLTLATITTVGTVNAITTLTTLTNQAQIGGANANDQVPALRRMAADTLLNKINIT